ncbi:hypothetical protein [Dyadobacter sp. 676]|uniref:Uncharacterized protein n=1 Tax=Dyadobacter sp. 676 TaxID=3088362 RepID=A0AAU8FHI1_9BACT
MDKILIAKALANLRDSTLEASVLFLSKDSRTKVSFHSFDDDMILG